MKTKHQDVRTTQRDSAFTLIELLVVMVTVAVLSLLLLPALAGTRPNSRAFQCLENQRRIMLAWRLYSNDNNDTIVPVSNMPGSSPMDLKIQPGGIEAQLYPGTMTTATQSTNLAFGRIGLLYPYLRSDTIFKCPADPRNQNYGMGGKVNKGQPTVRSYSENGWMNPTASTSTSVGMQTQVYWVFRTQTQIPRPTDFFTLVEEDPGPSTMTFFGKIPAAPVCGWIFRPVSIITVPGFRLPTAIVKSKGGRTEMCLVGQAILVPKIRLPAT